MTTFKQGIMQAARAFTESPEWKEAIASNTKAAQSGSSYKVELFSSGNWWRVLWENQIGNRYVSPGKIIALPAADLEDCETEDDFNEAVDFAATEEKQGWLEELEIELNQ